jgi:hypothetical protein
MGAIDVNQIMNFSFPCFAVSFIVVLRLRHFAMFCIGPSSRPSLYFPTQHALAAQDHSAPDCLNDIERDHAACST